MKYGWDFLKAIRNSPTEALSTIQSKTEIFQWKLSSSILDTSIYFKYQIEIFRPLNSK